MKSKLTLIIVFSLFLVTSLVAAQTATNARILNTPCAQAAVETRDAAISSAVAAFGASWQLAVDVRKVALKAAWGNTEKAPRKAAIKAAWAQYKAAHKAARNAYESTRRAAWKTYKATMRTCGTAAVSDDTTGEGVDAKVSQ